MNTFSNRVADAYEDTALLTGRLIGAARSAGYEDEQIDAALEWAAIQLDPEEDDYETWEATLLARLENPNSGER